jgi:hypothetical protein
VQVPPVVAGGHWALLLHGVVLSAQTPGMQSLLVSVQLWS